MRVAARRPPPLEAPAAQHDDGELEALGLVDGQEAHDVAVVVRPGTPARRPASPAVLGPGEEAARPPPPALAKLGRAPRASRGWRWPGSRRAGGGEELEQARVRRTSSSSELVRLARARAARAARAASPSAARDRRVAGGLLRRERSKAPAGGPEEEEVVVAEAEERRVQGAVHGRAVGRGRRRRAGTAARRPPRAARSRSCRRRPGTARRPRAAPARRCRDRWWCGSSMATSAQRSGRAPLGGPAPGPAGRTPASARASSCRPGSSAATARASASDARRRPGPPAAPYVARRRARPRRGPAPGRDRPATALVARLQTLLRVREQRRRTRC